jgi:EAL domain-containing protein (putative c-di-GMP-specific phosphodiesterase class I)
MTKPVLPFASSEERGAQSREREPAREQARALPGDREPESPLRVFIIDDDSEILENLVESLPSPAFKTQTASDANTLFDNLESFAPEVVITDMAMPSRDGIDVLRILRDRRYTGDVILMSGAQGQVLETARRVAVSYGLTIAGVLRKPFTPKQLLTLLAADSTSDDAGMGNALSERRIRPYFQPKVDLKTGRIVGAEALSRWQHPERGLLMPASYLNTKRATSRRSVHDYTMLERTIEFCGKLNQMGHPISVAVNFTADVILSDEFIEVMADAQRRHGIAPEQITVELTEHETSENFEELAERLLKLRLFGAHLSIDDFGVGHSSLSRIQRLPVSEIKIDRSFIRGLGEYSDNIAIVRSIVELAHSLHCQVVAEGVEAAEAVDTLKKAGCDLAQGYLFSPAVNESTFVALVRDNAFDFVQSGANASP